VAEEYERGSPEDYLQLTAGGEGLLSRLRRPARLAIPTPFVYPSKGPVVLFLRSDGAAVRLSEGGRLLRYLEGQGMELAADVVISKTVFHALQETPGAVIGNGEVSLATTVDDVTKDAPRFLQVVLELVGLRHSKYKDAIVQLSRAGDVSAPRPAPPSFWDDR
jgi:hypothetical protein